MKYIEFIAYPIMTLVVYFFMGLVYWDRDPGNWTWNARALWVIWTMCWGLALQYRLKLDRMKEINNENQSNPC
jgi:hypothetical protein